VKKIIGILVVTHGDLGKASVEAVELIAGSQKCVKTLGLHHGDGPEDFERSILDAVVKLDEGDGILAFVDFYGGTPANLVMKCMCNQKFPCIAGFNMPMLVEALTNRADCTLEELVENCKAIGEKSFIELHKIFEKLINNPINKG
jgi:PTS system mannose-specific IIA component